MKPFYLSNRSTGQTQLVPLLPGGVRRLPRAVGDGVHRRDAGGARGGGEVRINRSTYQVKPFYLSSETVLPIK